MFLTKSTIATSLFKTAPDFLVQRPFVRHSIIQYLKQILENSMNNPSPDDFPPEVWRDKVRVLQ
ncbi:MAG: hypothetical protein ACLFV2_03265, partial [Desulfurivibrionaceae bacterium]